MNPTNRIKSLADLPPTPFELEQERHAITTQQNELRERLRLREANEAKGHAEPKPGDKLHVQLDGSVTRRGRAGIRFERGARVELEVIDGTEEDVAAKQRAGAAVVSVLGAERIFEDTALHVFSAPMSPDEVEDLRAAKAAVEEELRVTRAERDELTAKVRAARMSAPDSPDGRPTRLAAAAKVKAEAQTSAPATAPASPAAAGAEHSEFGAPPAPGTK